MSSTRSAQQRARCPDEEEDDQHSEARFLARHRVAVTVAGAGLAAALFFFAGVGVASLVIAHQLKSNIGKLAAGFLGSRPAPDGQNGLPFGSPPFGGPPLASPPPEGLGEDLTGWAQEQGLPDDLPTPILEMLHQQYPDEVPGEVKDQIKQQFGG